MFLFNLFSLLLFASSVCATAPHQKPTGWLWYQDPAPLKEEVEKTKDSSPPEKAKRVPKTAVEQMDANRKYFEEIKARAILYPTLENVTKARHVHEAILEQVGAFQESWTLSELLDPKTPVNATSPGALKLDRERAEQDLERTLKDFSKTHGLIFVFKEDCPYCHQFAPVVMNFAQTHGFSVEGLSSSDGCFKGMTCTKNEKAVRTVNPEGAYPILYLANPTTNELIPIAKGFVSLSALLENITYALKFLNQQKGQAS
jgi:conjugal transfer pilus assembly protein TraF